jgi:hypothetical protein
MSFSKISNKNYFSKKEQDQPLISPLALGTAALLSDFSGKVRNATRLSNLMLGREQPLALLPMSVTSTFGLLLGPLTTKNSWKELQLSKKIGDTFGKRVSLFRCMGGVAEGISGLIYIPLRGLNLAMYYTTSKGVHLAGRILGISALATGVVPAFFNAVSSALRIHRLLSFRKQLFSAPPEEVVESLRKDLKVRKIERLGVHQEAKKSLKYLASSTDKQWMRIKKLTDRLELKKQRELSHVTSPEIVQSLKKSEEKAESIFQKINALTKHNMRWHSLIIAISVLTLAGVALGIVFTGGSLALVGALLMTIVSIGWFCLDGYQLMDAFKKDEHGKYERLWMLLSSIACFVVLTLAFYFSFGIAPFILAGIIGALWLSINGTCVYRLSTIKEDKEKKQRRLLSHFRT